MTMLAVAVAVVGGRADVRQQVQRKSRRKEKIVLTDENRIKGRKRIRLTTINSRQKKHMMFTKVTETSHMNDMM